MGRAGFSRSGWGARVLTAVAVLGSIVVVTPPDRTTSAAGTGYVSLASPMRLLDTRPGQPTADGQSAGTGLRPLGSTLELQVAGRVGIPAGTASAVLNVTVTGPQGDGFITAYPCDGGRPTASNLNYSAGQTVPNLVITRLDANGRVCLFNGGATHLIVDVAGYFPDADSLSSLPSPARLLDTRTGQPTVDGLLSGIGPRLAGSALQVQVTGRAGIPTGTTSVVLNVTVADATRAGYVTVYPCEAGRPTASNLNFTAGQTVPNSVIARLGVDGSICLYTFSAAQLIVDVAGYFSDASVLVPLGAPARLLDSRPGESTIDGAYRNTGVRPSGGTIRLPISGRAGVPANASAVILNVTATETQAEGLVTVYPTGEGRPTASNLNYAAGQTVPNAVTARLGAGGSICLFNLGATHLVVDIAGYIVGPPPPAAGPDCPADPPPPPVAPPPPVVPVAQPTNCHPSYVGACVPNTGADVDCAGGSGNGPYYVSGPFRVVGRDVFGLDADGDGIGCE